MKQSKLFTKTTKSIASEETSKNAQLLTRAGYINKELAGVYDYLPLGLRVLEKLKQVIREEMNSIDGQEVLMTTLQSKELWEKTDRWNSEKMDVWFKTELASGGELGLAPTHEEPLTNFLKRFVSSYKDLPFSVYQFQTKFRNELRAKSGIMRGREFMMKDLYSFSLNREQHDDFYERATEAYWRVFDRIGLKDITYKAFASGGVFAKYSHEFQTLCDVGEDTIYMNADKSIAINEEVFNDEVLAEFNAKKEDFTAYKMTETGNIFTLATKYSTPLELQYTDADGKKHDVFMGCYGIGVSRLIGALVEIFGSENAIKWPKSVAPFQVNLIGMGAKGMERANELYEKWTKDGIEVLFDDREKASFGEKMADSELIGCPLRILVGDKTLEQGEMAEVKWQGLDNEKPENLQDLMSFDEIQSIVKR